MRWVAWVLAAGCAGPTPCEEAEDRLGHSVCVHEVADGDAWATIAVGPVADVWKTAKYLAPARDDARLSVLFADAHEYTLHYDVLVDAFPADFPDLSPTEYLALVQPADRELLAGAIEERADGFSFTILDDPADPATTVDLAAATRAYDELSSAFLVGDLSFRPSTDPQRAAAAGWDAPFPIR